MYYVYPARFQPLTKLHEKEILQLVDHIEKNDKGSKIIIGIVKYEPKEAGDPEELKRLQPQFNPLTYWERILQIEQFITDNNLEDIIQCIVPLPQPSAHLDKAKHFLPPNDRRICFSRAKFDLINGLVQQGEDVYKINYVEPEIGIISSQLIFSLITLGNDRWMDCVNDFVREQMLNVIKIGKRLQTGWLCAHWTPEKARVTIEDLIADARGEEKTELIRIANLSSEEAVSGIETIEAYNSVEDVKAEITRIYTSLIVDLENLKNKLTTFKAVGFTKTRYITRINCYNKIIESCRDRKDKTFRELFSVKRVSNTDFRKMKDEAKKTVDGLQELSIKYCNEILNVVENDNISLEEIFNRLLVELKNYES